MVERRWDSDDRRLGVADAGALVPQLDRLRKAMLAEGWVAEEPEQHLLPHVRRLCEERGWKLARAEVEDAVLCVDVVVAGSDRPARLTAAYALLGTFAEPATFVRQAEARGAFELELATGVLAGDSEFAPHGHTVRIRVSG